MTVEVLEDVLSDLLGGAVIDPHRQCKRDMPGFFGVPAPDLADPPPQTETTGDQP